MGIGRWKKQPLKELCTRVGDGLHGTPKYSDSSSIPFINGNNLKNGNIIVTESTNYVTQEEYDKNFIELNSFSLLLSINGTLGSMAFYNGEQIMLGKSAAYLNFKTEINKFQYYYFQLPSVQNYFYNVATGSTIKNLSLKSIQDFEVPVPDVKEYKQIAKVLSDLDAKIEVNNKINQELEAMAKLIYDYWFVQFDFPFDFVQGKPDPNGKPYKSSGGKMVYNKELKREIPEGWECSLLGKLGNFKNGVNYDPSNPGEIACPIINVRNISASRFFLKNEDLDIIYLRESDVRKYAVHDGSIIIARSGIPGATRLIADYEENTLYCGFAIHYELKNLDLKLAIFFYLKSIEELIKNGSGGTILKNVNQATLNNLKIALPNSEKIIESFNQKIIPIFRKINLIQKENQKLSELRDWLLPMLMNGQVRVAHSHENGNLGAEEQLGMVAEEGAKYGNR